MRTLLFVVFKIIELIGVVAVYLGLCRLGWWVGVSVLKNADQFVWYNPVYLLIPISAIFILVTAIIIIAWLINDVFPWWIESNKDLVNKILGNGNR